MNVQDVDKWLITDDSEFNMNFNELIQSVLHDFDNMLLKEIEQKNLLTYCLLSITDKSKFYRETAECNFAASQQKN